MSSFLTDNEVASLKADLDSVWATFSSGRNIVVWKEPNRIISQPPVGGQFGFGGTDVEQQVTFIPQSGIYPAVVRYANARHIGQTTTIDETNAMIPIGECKIKVAADCYNYIENGQTDKISFDNRDWFFVGKAQACPFMGTLYYIYQLKPKI